VEANRDDIVRYVEHRLEDAEVAVFAYGICGRSAKTAVDNARAEGIRAGLFRPLTIWPFPEEQVASLAGRVRSIIVPELSLGQIILEVERCARGRCRVEGIHRVDGDPIHPGQILARIKEAV
jgi:2-oxoglutarate ferredoxin oxidoreductase subunit alpha